LRRGSRFVSAGRWIACGLILCLPATSVGAQGLREPEFMVQARRGFDDIYNLDYDQAEQVFRSLKKEVPRHPAPPLYLGAIVWLRELFHRQDLDLDRFLSPAFFVRENQQALPAAQRKDFMDDIQECQMLAQERLARNPRDADALYFLAASYGILASFSITLDHSLSKAFSYGNKGYDYDRQAIRLDVNYYDAYMTVGLYQYVVGSMPWYFRLLAAVVGFHGSKEQGFQDVEIAARGEYVKTDARVVQMVLFMREGKPQDALRFAQELHRDFPRNYIFQINIAQILEIMGRTDQAVAEYLDVVRRAAAGEANYRLLPLAVFHYTLGYKFFRMRRFALAQAQLQDSIDNPATLGTERALSELRLGQIMDLAGRRQEALEHYRRVLGLQDVDNSHELARSFIQKPYRG
jgi:tetratricopeptide (TPR) repeat protein